MCLCKIWDIKNQNAYKHYSKVSIQVPTLDKISISSKELHEITIQQINFHLNSFFISSWTGTTSETDRQCFYNFSLLAIQAPCSYFGKIYCKTTPLSKLLQQANEYTTQLNVESKHLESKLAAGSFFQRMFGEAFSCLFFLAGTVTGINLFAEAGFEPTLLRGGWELLPCTKLLEGLLSDFGGSGRATGIWK